MHSPGGRGERQGNRNEGQVRTKIHYRQMEVTAAPQYQPLTDTPLGLELQTQTMQLPTDYITTFYLDLWCK